MAVSSVGSVGVTQLPQLRETKATTKTQTVDPNWKLGQNSAAGGIPPGSPTLATPSAQEAEKAAAISKFAAQLQALPNPYTGPTDPKSMAKEFVKRTEGKIGTDHQFVNLALQLAHSQGQTSELNAHVRDELTSDPSNWTLLRDKKLADTKENGSNAALKYVINDELSGLKNKQAMDCLIDGKINHGTDSKASSMLDGADDALTGMFDTVKDHPFATVAAVAGTVAAVAAAPVVGTVLAVGAAGMAAYKVGSAAVDIATAKTDEQKSKAYHDLGGGTVDAALAATGASSIAKAGKFVNAAIRGGKEEVAVLNTAKKVEVLTQAAEAKPVPPPPAAPVPPPAAAPVPAPAAPLPAAPPAPASVKMPTPGGAKAQLAQPQPPPVQQTVVPQKQLPVQQQQAQAYSGPTNVPTTPPVWEAQLSQAESAVSSRAASAEQLAKTPTTNMSPAELQAHTEKLKDESKAMERGLDWAQRKYTELQASGATPNQLAAAGQRLGQMRQTAYNARTSLNRQLETLRSTPPRVTQPTAPTAAQSTMAPAQTAAPQAARLNQVSSELDTLGNGAHNLRNNKAPLEQLEAHYNQLKQAISNYREAGGKPGNGDPNAVITRAQNASDSLVSEIGSRMSQTARATTEGTFGNAKQVAKNVGDVSRKSAQELDKLEQQVNAALSDVKGVHPESQVPTVANPQLQAERTIVVNRVDRDQQAVTQELNDALSRIGQRRAQISQTSERNAAAQQHMNEFNSANVAAANKVAELKESLGPQADALVTRFQKGGLDHNLDNAVRHFQNSIADDALPRFQGEIKAARALLEKQHGELKAWFEKNNAADLPGEVRQFLGQKFEAADQAYRRASNQIANFEENNGLQAAAHLDVAPIARQPLNLSQARGLLKDTPPAAKQNIRSQLNSIDRTGGRSSFGLTEHDLVRARELGII